ncbi:MAG: hypothetical protein Fur003_3400 [Candidatus Dojkabacteria bacterium]
MNTKILEAVEKDQYKSRPQMRIGDTVRLHLKIREGDKERVQVFEGILIAVKGVGLSKTITVRKISSGVGVERIVPVHAPTLDKIEVIKSGGRIRRSKLYFMRERVGKLAMKIKGTEYVEMEVEKAVDEVAAPESVESTDTAETVEAPVEAAEVKSEEVVAEAPAAEAKEEPVEEKAE